MNCIISDFNIMAREDRYCMCSVLTQVLTRAMIHNPAFHRAMRGLMHTPQIRKVSQVARGIELVGVPQLECIIQSKRRIIYFSEPKVGETFPAPIGASIKEFWIPGSVPPSPISTSRSNSVRTPPLWGERVGIQVLLTVLLTRTPWISAFDSVL